MKTEDIDGMSLEFMNLMLDVVKNERIYLVPIKDAKSFVSRWYLARKALINQRPDLSNQLGFTINQTILKEEGNVKIRIGPRLEGMEKYLLSGRSIEQIMKTNSEPLMIESNDNPDEHGMYLNALGKKGD